MTRDERQKLGIQKWIKAGCRGTLEWCTGTGKTHLGLLGAKVFLSKNPDKKVVVIVPSEYLQTQWITRLNKEGLLLQVTVEIINSAINREDQIDLVILDEIHRIGAETFYNVFVKRQPKLVLGLTATFDRLDGRHSLLKHYCPVIDTLTLQEALDNKWLSPYKEYKILIEPDDIEEYRKLNADFFNYFSYFQNNFDFAMKCVTGIRKGNKIIKPSHYVRYEYAQALCTLPTSHPGYKSMVNSIFKEISAVTFSWNRALQARKSYVANHPKKIEITRKILAARPNSKAITFSATIKQAEKIGNGFVIHSGKTKSKNRITAEEFANVKIGVLHTSKKLDEGADIPGLNLAIILSNTSSKTQKTQRIGHWPM